MKAEKYLHDRYNLLFLYGQGGFFLKTVLPIINNKIFIYSLVILLGIVSGFTSLDITKLAIILFTITCAWLLFLSTRKKTVIGVILAYLLVTVLLPKAGIKMAGLPITISNLLLMCSIVVSIIYLLLKKDKKIQYSYVNNFVTKYLIISSLYFGLFLSLSFYEHGMTSTLVNFIPNLLPIVSLFILFIFFQGYEHKVVKVLSIASVFLVLYGTIQLMFGHYKTIIPGITVNYSDYIAGNVFEGKNNLTALGLKLVSTYQNGNLYGSILIFTSLWFIQKILNKQVKRSAKLFYFFMFILSTINIIATLSRSALIGLVVGMVVFSILVKRVRKYLIALMAFGTVGIILSGYSERLFAKDYTAAGRTFQYQDYINSFSGMNFFEKIRMLTIGRGIGFEEGMFGDSTLRTVESGVLNLITYTGVIGFLIYLTPLLFSGVMLWKFKNRMSVNFLLGATLFASLVGMWGQISIDQLLNLPPTGQNYWILLSFLFLIIRKQEKESKEPDVVEEKQELIQKKQRKRYKIVW